MVCSNTLHQNSHLFWAGTLEHSSYFSLLLELFYRGHRMLFAFCKISGLSFNNSLCFYLNYTILLLFKILLIKVDWNTAELLANQTLLNVWFYLLQNMRSSGYARAPIIWICISKWNGFIMNTCESFLPSRMLFLNTPCK